MCDLYSFFVIDSNIVVRNRNMGVKDYDSTRNRTLKLVRPIYLLNIIALSLHWVPIIQYPQDSRIAAMA